MSFRKYWYTITLAFSLFTLISCDDLSFHNGISHGKIEYDISYPDIPADSYILDLMPKKMETTFKNNSYRNDIIAGMGLFKTSIICESGKDKLVHSVKMLNKKYASTLDSDELIKFNPSFQNIEVVLNDEKKEIAGYHCKGATIKVLGDSTWTFKLFYTDEINIEGANNHTPFKEINGVLMEYEIYSYDTHMQFIASKVNQIDIEDGEIPLEDGYEMINSEELKKQIEAIFDKVK